MAFSISEFGDKVATFDTFDNNTPLECNPNNRCGSTRSLYSADAKYLLILLRYGERAIEDSTPSKQYNYRVPRSLEFSDRASLLRLAFACLGRLSPHCGGSGEGFPGAARRCTSRRY